LALPEKIGGGAIDSPPAKRVWRRPSIRVMPVGATKGGLKTGLLYVENINYADCTYDGGQRSCIFPDS